MAYVTNAVVARIHWCRTQRSQARTALELQEWRAEEEGLRDAILKTDHTDDYRQYPRPVFERYAMGLQDGQMLIRYGAVSEEFASHSR